MAALKINSSLTNNQWIRRISYSIMENFFQKLPGKFNDEALVYLWLFFLCLLCYGLLIPFLGFYWDDLPYLYQYHVNGPFGFSEFVSFDRPFSAWIFMATTWLFGFHPLGYHILAFLLRFASAILFYRILKILLPEHAFLQLTTASIFAVYPGFLQQPIALIYNHHLAVLCLFLLSILTMLKNAARQRFSLTLYLISILASLGMFSIENFAPLELARPVLLWVMLGRSEITRKEKFNLFIKQYTPFLIIFISFLYWRIFLFGFPTYEPSLINELAREPYQRIGELFNRIPADFLTVTWQAWSESIFFPTISDFGLSATIFFWMLVLTSLVSCLLFFPFFSRKNNYKQIQSGSLFIFCLFLFLLAGSIVWVLNLPLGIEFAWDRMTLAFIPAVSLFAGWIIYLFRKIPLLNLLLPAILISSAVGSHFQNGMAYKRDWENFQDFFWQLAWRIPDLSEQTTLVSSDIGLDFYSDNSLTSPLNLTYAPENQDDNLEYMFYFTGVRLETRLNNLKPDHEFEHRYRSFNFAGTTSKMIALKYSPPDCLMILDRRLSNSITNPNLSDLQVQELRRTDLDLIQPTPQNLPFLPLMGPQPDKNWCYYFQKADLSRQAGEFSTVVKLGNEVFQKKLNPRSASEWLPFLEGYIRTADWDMAEIVAEKIAFSEGNYIDGLCYTLRRIKGDENFSDHIRLHELIEIYNCQN